MGLIVLQRWMRHVILASSRTFPAYTRLSAELEGQRENAKKQESCRPLIDGYQSAHLIKLLGNEPKIGVCGPTVHDLLLRRPLSPAVVGIIVRFDRYPRERVVVHLHGIRSSCEKDHNSGKSEYGEPDSTKNNEFWHAKKHSGFKYASEFIGNRSTNLPPLLTFVPY